jgi:hypothetical protein
VSLSREESEKKARHFANTVFYVGSGLIILAASLLQPLLASSIGGSFGDNVAFIAATVLIFVLASKRVDLALLSLKRQCSEHGHLLNEAGTACTRCLQELK